MSVVRSDVAKTAADLQLVLGRLRRRLRNEASLSGLPSPQISALRRVLHEGPMTTSELAAVERVRPQSMAATLLALYNKGLVERSNDPNDKRKVSVSVTPVGRKVVVAHERSRGDWLARAIATSFTREEQKVLTKAVRQLETLADCEVTGNPSVI